MRMEEKGGVKLKLRNRVLRRKEKSWDARGFTE
jgi:hypothetical protein